MVSLEDLQKRRRELTRKIREAEQAANRNLRQEDIRRRAAAISREHQREVREIGPPPDIVNQSRRDYCRTDLLAYLKTYHAQAFPLEFSADHLRLIEIIRCVVMEGGNVVVAMPRGSGKTTICQHAEIWAALYGHRRYPMLVAADDPKFKILLEGIKRILETNELLAEDFPEIIHPVRALERIANRANFQMCRGQPTFMKWGTDQLVFPTLEESLQRGNAGVVIRGGGITGAGIRGGVATRPDGSAVRPDCVLIDDPQTRESAGSAAGNRKRGDIISGDVLGMAGPGEEMAAMVTCTVIYRGDLADRLLDPQLNPDWKSVKVQTIQAWPSDMTAWEAYDGVRRRELLGELEPGATNRYYQEHRQELEAGAQVYWPVRVGPGKVSALQTAMDDWLRDPRAFMSERQNTPEEDVAADLEPLNPIALVKRVTRHARGRVPHEATVLTAHIDVQERLLYWMVCAWTPSFRGYIIDYGAYPEPSTRYFLLRNVHKTLQTVSGNNDMPGSIMAGIKNLVQRLASRVWRRDDGAEMRITRGLVDARYLPEVIHRAVKEAGEAAWLPAYGMGLGAKHAPMEQYPAKPGRLKGHKWMVERPATKLLMSGFYDTNYWKTMTHQALTVATEHSAAITVYAGSPSHHQLLADHLSSERAIKVEARGRTVDEWTLPSNKPDNHFWDNLVANMAAASMLGIARKETQLVSTRRAAGKRGRAIRRLKV